MFFRRTLESIAAAVLLGACTSSSGVSTSPAPAARPPAIRVVESASNRAISFDELASAAGKADVVFFGEQHDDPETHFAEFALLEAIGRVRSRVVVSLEMFERDVQPLLDDYLAGRTPEAEFLAKSRPWERYATDYRALVVLARARGWPVIAANVPRPIASAVSRKGLAALDSLPPGSRAWAARDNSCPHDAYFDRFAETMKGHGGPGTSADSAAARVITQRFYEAQCVKDETMGESIARAAAASPGAIVVHFDGAFHSDFGLGTAARARRRLPNAKVLVVTAIPVADLAAPLSADAASRAQFVILTRKAPDR